MAVTAKFHGTMESAKFSALLCIPAFALSEPSIKCVPFADEGHCHDIFDC